MSDIYTSVLEDDSSSEYSSDTDSVNIKPIKRQKTLVIDSDTESENETHSAEDDFTGMSGVTIECNNPQSVITQLWAGQKKNR